MNEAILIATLALATPLVGCDDDEPAPSAPRDATDPAAALDSYEAIRARLAADDTSGLDANAKKLAGQARAAAESASGEAKQHLEKLAAASDGLAAAGDIEAAREAFGEVSRHVVALVAAKPELQKGRHVFECPMSPGYEKWVQTDDAMKNPYMGKKMLECGSVSSWDS